MAETVGVRELRRDLSKYLARVEEGESFAVTSRGRTVARLTPERAGESVIDRLVRVHGATRATGNVLDIEPLEGEPITPYLDEVRADRDL